jgi:hypothetical protein
MAGAAYWTRSQPLVAGSCALVVILARPFVSAIAGSVGALESHGVSALVHYDPVKALFCAVFVLTATLAWQTARLNIGLRRKLKELHAPTEVATG